MKKELTMSLIILLALAADSLCFREIYLKTDAIYLRASGGFLLLAAGVALLVMFGFFIKRLRGRQS